MKQWITAGKTILLNTATNCTFLASVLDEKTQLRQGNVEHIEIAGELDIKIRDSQQVNYPDSMIGSDLEKELIAVLNRHSMETGSNTPDYILSQFLLDQLSIWNKNVMMRDRYYNEEHSIIPGKHGAA